VNRQATQSLPSTVIAGALIGVLGGMIGLGGAVPVAATDRGVRVRRFAGGDHEQGDEPVVGPTALSARLFSVPWSDVAPHLVRGGEPARREPGGGMGRRGLGDADSIGEPLVRAGDVDRVGRRRLGRGLVLGVVLGVVPSAVLIPLLVVPLVSSVKVWRHE